MVMHAARRAGLEGAVLDAEVGHVALEADSDGPAPEACEVAMFGRWETTELPSTLLDQLEGRVSLSAR